MDYHNIIADLFKMRNIQHDSLSTDRNDYMVGLYNGLEMALAMFEERDPMFEQANETNKLVSTILSCFSNDDLINHISARGILRSQEKQQRDDSVKSDESYSSKQSNPQEEKNKYWEW